MSEDENDALIRWMLSLTPTRRLEVVQEFIDGVWAMRKGREEEYGPEDWETRPLPREVMEA